MSIVVFWLEESGAATHCSFEQNELTHALKCTEEMRQAGKRHVCISSELGDSVGKPGVTGLDGRTLPDGSKYEWTKAHRGAGPGPRGR